MLTVRHHTHGAPEKVLKVVEVPDLGDPSPGHLRIRAEFVAIHPGDLQGVEGAANFGSPPPIGKEGRTPGFEGVGIIEAIGAGVDPSLGLVVGQWVAYFPIANGWSEQVQVLASSATVLPEGVRPEVAAQVLINTVTAETVIRAGHNAWPEDKRQNVTVIQTGAASAVGRILTTLLVERGVATIRLVRSEVSADALEKDGHGPVISTEDPNWKGRLRDAIAGREIYVALDGVGGPTFPGVAEMLAPGGTVISYGALGGANTDIRLVVPRGLTIKGVNIGQWGREPAQVRQADIQTAMRLAGTKPELFPVEAAYPPGQIQQAVKHLLQPGRTGAVLLAF